MAPSKLSWCQSGEKGCRCDHCLGNWKHTTTPFRGKWSLEREGFTADTVSSLIKRTLLNPYLTLPLWLLSRFTTKGRALLAERPKSAKALLAFLAVGIAGRFRDTLDRGTVNNWTTDVYDWKKEIVVVTGGSDGIGAKVVKILAERGVKIVVLDIQPLKYDSHPNVFYFKCDLCSSADIKTACDDIIKYVGHPTVLINNAGFARGKSFLDISPDDLRLTYQINTLCHFQLAQQFLPHMIRHNHGMIVTVASLAGFVTAPRMADYAGSKAAAISTHEALQVELATLYKAKKVRTVLVCQGYTKTSLFKGFHPGDGFVSYALEADTVAENIAKAVLRGESDMIVLPRVAGWNVAGLRGASLWWQTKVRQDTLKLMTKFDGRQVLQPSEEKSVEGSGVLV